jgi:hypothetical protein
VQSPLAWALSQAECFYPSAVLLGITG